MDKYIYISIPKTGTNSVHKLLGNSYFNHITANTIRNKIYTYVLFLFFFLLQQEK